ncbi:NADH oxidase [Apilactobacillus kunkeei]|uniref:NADH oxidase n=1 Tax=Apilactobacillus kunkeei DSM 12361 = ATCC 700308 TaxID=1423768 RepID=A0A0R1FKU1_9LACO|nr:MULTISPECIES: FAD-dependent oxidoreductase [Apilactobacillus]KOY72225.1 NADH oxidase [Apilactobacillus kunkeei DSM 12361 = ATCC 700308]KRK22573.1 NADH oxidase [Apilactobacillus kunkeei DSM 12361 = ATCC 700308]MDN2613017.1 FAD-dependent oxidoreductase [Apilactobacillus sp. EABW-1NA]QYU52889.1 FAD-dependent oxidoreductase [Apilactobacillus kunkeei]CAI2659571.1 NADH oxidase [Apilactobacillus kunkeei]
MKVIVIGCTHAGTFAVKQILKEHPDAQVTVYERNDNISFLSCGIALYLDGKVKDPQGLFYSNPKELSDLGADVKMLHSVKSVDTDAKTIEVENLDSHDVFTDKYDKLVMTTGSRPVLPPIEGRDNKNVFFCKNWHDAQILFEKAKNHKRIAVVGAGYIGAELAEAFSNHGHETTLINSDSHVLSKYFDKKFTDKIEELYTDHNVKLELGVRVQKFSGDDELTLSTGDHDIKADMAILCVGFQPNTELLTGKVDMMDNGAIITNEYMQSSNPDIFAAGDSAAVHFNPSETNEYIPLATNAVRQGILVGKNIEKPTTKYMGTQSSSGLQLYDYALVSTGMTVGMAERKGMKASSVVVEDNYRPEFMPTTEKVLMELVYDPSTRRILGGSLMSRYDISQSANTLSVLIQNKNTIDDLAMVDMLFQPNFDRPFHYLNILGQAAQAQEEK